MATPSSTPPGPPQPGWLLGALISWPAWVLIWATAWLPAAAVLCWALVFALTPRHTGRWPWWVVGQWATLTAILTWGIVGMDNQLSIVSVAGAALFAVIALVVWMAPAVIAELHRTHWHTKRPPADHDRPDSSSGATSDHRAPLR